MLEPSDDLRHKLAAGPHARESLFYNVLLPDEGLLVFFYTWVDADNRAGHLFAVVTDNDERLAFSATDGVEVGGRDFDDWVVQGLWLRHTDPLRGAEFGIDVDGASLRVEFTATHAAFDYAQNEDGCPRFLADNRFEQSARVRGELTLRGGADGRSAGAPLREIHFDTTGHRDHSWGTRDWDTVQDWKWVSAQTADGHCLNVMQLHAHGQTTRHGYVVRDDVVEPVVDVRTRVDYDDNWYQRELWMTVTDAAGRQTEVTAQRYALLRFDAGERLVLHEAACRGTVDGTAALVHYEAGWDRSYVALHTARRATP